MKIDRRENLRFSDWAPESGTPDNIFSAERMIQTMEDIIRSLCAYGMEYKDHEGYTHNLQHKPGLYHREITLTGRKRVEPPVACGSPEEKSSIYQPVRFLYEAFDNINKYEEYCDCPQ
ncbi:hypothetical protein O181_042727 [Austropuccinia psidii MF-1]|uniref:Uncharacterized protein n=1 Tax=Austropuccinia psidii MF-1 TaxID=1389203 RepID=A0A9Q3DND7_9BASI|nr:hypothetical protein [Austropuccinia psidii MF-1]